MHQSEMDAFMWIDSSQHMVEHPSIYAKRMIDDGIGFSGFSGPMGLSENTHHLTYEYLNIPLTRYKNFREIQSGHLLLVLKSRS